LVLHKITMWEFFKNPLGYFSAEAREERAREGQMREIWKKEGSGLPYERWRTEVEKEDARHQKEYEQQQAQRRQRTDQYIHHLGKIGQWGPEASRQGKGIDATTKTKILGALRGVAWMDRRKGGTGAIHYPEIYHHTNLDLAATQVFRLSNHPHPEVREAAQEVLEKFTTAFDRICWKVEEMKKKK